MLYQAVPKGVITDHLIRLRDLYRQRRPLTNRERIAHEKREAITKNLIDNLFRTKAHPTLRTVLDVAEIFSLTLDGAHRLFGYHLDTIRQYDLYLNGGRTHILDTYPYNRDLPIDLPLRLGNVDNFKSGAALRDLVLEWQTGLPIRVIDDPQWARPGVFYVHVGTRDSLGSSLPPGSLALVEPITLQEERRPDPRSIYLLQFGNGYRCSRCVVTGNKLFLISDQRLTGQREFIYPGTVRVAGRIHGFSIELPLPEYPDLGSLPPSPRPAPLILPWEHTSRDRLFQTKHQRFTRDQREKEHIKEFLFSEFATQLTERTERRYRRPSSSQPHIDTLLQMILCSTARYGDALRSGRSLPSDQGRFSLQTLLAAHSFADIAGMPERSREPEPLERWSALRARYPEWPTPLSMNFPNLRLLEDQITRLPEGAKVKGLSPALAPGSMLLLEEASVESKPMKENHDPEYGWSRPLYALRRGADIVCGYLRSESGRFHLLTGTESEQILTETEEDRLYRVAGAVVPV